MGSHIPRVNNISVKQKNKNDIAFQQNIKLKTKIKNILIYIHTMYKSLHFLLPKLPLFHFVIFKNYPNNIKLS